LTLSKIQAIRGRRLPNVTNLWVDIESVPVRGFRSCEAIERERVSGKWLAEKLSTFWRRIYLWLLDWSSFFFFGPFLSL